METQSSQKRVRSTSYDSVSTISTNRSPSGSPRRAQELPPRRRRTSSISRSRSPARRSEDREDARSYKRYPSASRSPTLSSMRSRGDSERKRRRSSQLSADSYSSEDRPTQSHDPKALDDDRNKRRRYQEASPVGRGRRTDSSRPERLRREHSNDRRFPVSRDENRTGRDTGGTAAPRPAPRQRSLSPFSKRLALTQAMNMGR